MFDNFLDLCLPNFLIICLFCFDDFEDDELDDELDDEDDDEDDDELDDVDELEKVELEDDE